MTLLPDTRELDVDRRVPHVFDAGMSVWYAFMPTSRIDVR
jgi:hypothetical protein